MMMVEQIYIIYCKKTTCPPQAATSLMVFGKMTHSTEDNNDLEDAGFQPWTWSNSALCLLVFYSHTPHPTNRLINGPFLSRCVGALNVCKTGVHSKLKVPKRTVKVGATLRQITRTRLGNPSCKHVCRNVQKCTKEPMVKTIVSWHPLYPLYQTSSGSLLLLKHKI